MTEQQKMWFENLVKDRQDNAKMIEKPSMRGVKTSVVEKYSDQAHFIYELLQNADDAKATFAKFDVEECGLYFTHNGTIHFTVSDPLTEDADGKNNQLGHINSITSIGSSSKNDQSTIGKFGVGFKAVFQYTETPHIYDQNFQFKIERFIVPVKLKMDIEERHPSETVFYFPFDIKEMPKEKAYSDVLYKLKSLNYPILFLSNLQEVKWVANGETGVYFQKIIGKVKVEGNINYKKLELLQQVGLETKNEKLLLFSKQVEGRVHSYSVGFFLDKGKLKPKNLPAFCFFPTKEITNLNFIIHAPFLLTDSREGIKKDDDWNIKAVKKLAELAADSLLILRDLKLIDDEIISIVPYKEKDFLEEDCEDEKLFYPFFKEIKKKFQTEELLPAKDGEYVSKKDAYWFQDSSIVKLFSDKQLAILVENKRAKWVFISLARKSTEGEKEFANYEYKYPKRQYIDDCIQEYFDLEDLLQKITADFIKKQSAEWLHKLYEYLSKALKTYERYVKDKPIFKDTNGNAVAAFQYEIKTKDYRPILFLPSDDESSTYTYIHKELLSNKTSKEFITTFGIKEPDIRDEIFNKISPLYDIGGDIDTDSHFKKFFRYYKENHGNKTEIVKLITEIKDKPFVSCKSKNDQKTYRERPDEIYYPNNDLLKYFVTKPDTMFVDLDDYYKQIDKDDNELLYEFLWKLGVNTVPKIIENELDYAERIQFKLPHYLYNFCFDKEIDGCKELLENIDIQKSLALWNCLISLIKYYSFSQFQELLQGVQKYKKRYDGYFYENKFNSTGKTHITESKWLFTKSGHFVAPHKITINDLVEGYDVKRSEAQSLIEFLQFKPTIILTKEQRIFQMFSSEEEAKRAKELLDFEKAKNERKSNQNSSESDYTTTKLDETIGNLDTLSKSISKTHSRQKESSETSEKAEIQFDEDKDFAKGVDELKKQLEIKKSRVDLANAINENKKYSYHWFESFLKLLLTYGETQSTTQMKSLSFQEIKHFKIDNKISDKYFLLCGANGYIPQSIEDSEDFKVTLKLKNNKDEYFSVEGVSKKGQDLLIYCREAVSQTVILQLADVLRVEINFTPVIDLLERLNRAFTNKNYVAEWEDIVGALPALKYIYGPPGTGKTTTLCAKIDEIIKENPNAKFLVLTPTNKAADVLCKKLIGLNSGILMVRLGKATDPELKEIDDTIYRDSLSLDDLHVLNVVASTIHRLPYFEIKNEKNGEKFSYRLFNHQYFDYVIFDESSMIGLPYIIFAIMTLHKTNPDTKFIVAGDPKQIPPVIEVNDKELENFDFQDENIYKMMRLESFNPKEQVIRVIDKIENLNRQYRSVKQIGQLFSELSYDKLLKHDREDTKRESRPLPDELKKLISSTVTFINIPLNQDNSIYKINKLFYSSYQTYCAILVAEIIKFFDKLNKDEQWTIGLIAPYKAQAILLNKLVTSYGISDNLKVYSDTVHGFQGDECDIVFFVVNPNNYHYTNHPKCLLSKEYIYNVAISRAKDYLIILHPFSEIRNNKFVVKITQSYHNNFGTFLTKQTPEVEKIIFGKGNFIESNSYTTGHDNVNVFGITDMKYFIKVGDSAIDIQLRKTEANFNDKSVKESGKAITDKAQIPKLSDDKVASHNNSQNEKKQSQADNDKLPLKKKKRKRIKQRNVSIQKLNDMGLSEFDKKIINMTKQGGFRYLGNSGYDHGLSDW